MRYVPAVIKAETINNGASLHQVYSDVQELMVCNFVDFFFCACVPLTIFQVALFFLKTNKLLKLQLVTQSFAYRDAILMTDIMFTTHLFGAVL